MTLLKSDPNSSYQKLRIFSRKLLEILKDCVNEIFIK